MRSGPSDVLRVSSVALLAFAAAASAEALGIFVQPPHVYASVDAPSIMSPQITLTSTGEDAAVVVTPTFFDMDDRGRPRGCDVESGRTLVPWVSVTRSRLVLTSARSEMLEFRLAVPRSAAGSYWCAVAIDVQPLIRSSALAVQPRIMVPVVVTVRGTGDARVRVGALSAFIASEREIVVEGSISNEGNVLLRAPLVVAIETGASIDPVEIASSDDATLFVLPGRRREFRVTIRGAFAGVRPLTASVWIPAGGTPNSVVEATCDVLPNQPPCVSSQCVRG